MPFNPVKPVVVTFAIVTDAPVTKPVVDGIVTAALVALLITALEIAGPGDVLLTVGAICAATKEAEPEAVGAQSICGGLELPVVPVPPTLKITNVPEAGPVNAVLDTPKLNIPKVAPVGNWLP